MVNLVSCDPLVSACRQRLDGQRILEAQGRNESAFFPLSTLLQLGAGQHCLRRFFLGQKTMSLGPTKDPVSLPAFWPIPQLWAPQSHKLTWKEMASWSCACCHTKFQQVFHLVQKYPSLQAMGQLKEVRGAHLNVKVGACRGLPTICFPEHFGVSDVLQSILWCIQKFIPGLNIKEAASSIIAKG